MNLPNRLTLTRIILVPFILLFMLPLGYPGFENWDRFVQSYGMLIALVIFVAASLTDYFDGHIARSRQLISTLGKFLDPIADKVLVLSVFIALVERGRISALVAIIVLFREFVVSGIRLIAAERSVVIAASVYGKLKTVSQMTAIILIMIEMSLKGFQLDAGFLNLLSRIGDGILYISVILTILSGIDYLSKNRNFLKSDS